MFRSRHALFAAPVVSLAFALFGCATTDEEAAEQGEGQAATASCSADKYQEAFVHYRKATYGAKARLDGVSACEGEGTAADGTKYPLYLTSIADEASAAVMICGTFRETIKTSPYAEPIRKLLGDSLTLDSLTGQLLVIRDSQFQNWTGVEALLPGTSLWTPGQGAGNWHSRIDFKANGQANYYRIDATNSEPWFKETNVAATYTVEKTGADKDPRRIIVKHGGVTETLNLGVQNPSSDQSWTVAPEFKACPANAEPWDCYYSLGPGECDA
jgi:hypothetical protein